MSFVFDHQVHSLFLLISQASCVAETINVGVENLFKFQALTLPRPHRVNMLPKQEEQKKQELSRSEACVYSKVEGNHLFSTVMSVKPVNSKSSSSLVRYLSLYQVLMECGLVGLFHVWITGIDNLTHNANKKS